MTQIVIVNGRDREDFLRRAGAVERLSEHPLAEAVVRAAGLDADSAAHVTGFRTFAGQGVKATVTGTRVLLGTAAFMAGNQIDISELTEQAQACTAQGQSVFFVASNGQADGLIAVADPIKQSSHAAIEALKNAERGWS